jgi:NDP-sugar pyrophosphorylase family protein
MKAMILAAGLGTRLRPLTRERAKPATPLLGKPLIVRLVEWLKSQGAGRFRINLHHLPETITSLFPDSGGQDPVVSFSFEPTILGTAGGLKNNQAFFESGAFFMVNGDIATDADLEGALDFHRRKGALATLVLKRQTPPFAHYPVRMDAEGRLVGFKGRDTGGAVALPDAYVFTGIHILEPEIFSYIPECGYYDINDSAYQAAMDDGQAVLGYRVEGRWSDLGTPGAYLRAHFDLLAQSGAGDTSFLSRSATVAEGAKVGPRAVLGENCLIEEAAEISDSVLWDHVTVKKGIKLERCIVGSGVTVCASAKDMVITLNGAAPIQAGW